MEVNHHIPFDQGGGTCLQKCTELQGPTSPLMWRHCSPAHTSQNMEQKKKWSKNSHLEAPFISIQK